MFEENNTPEVIEEVVETTLLGTVVDCKKLNVRKHPSIKSDVVCIISEASEVIINNEKSRNDFYKVTTSAGIEGFCMKKYIRIEP